MEGRPVMKNINVFLRKAYEIGLSMKEMYLFVAFVALVSAYAYGGVQMLLLHTEAPWIFFIIYAVVWVLGAIALCVGTSVLLRHIRRMENTKQPSPPKTPPPDAYILNRAA